MADQENQALARRDGGAGAEPFGYWVQHTLSEPVFLRPPAFIPSGDNYTVTPLYTHPAPASAPGDDWIEWHGGENPAGDEIVEVEFIDGETGCWQASEPEWAEFWRAGAIARYRLAALRQPDTAGDWPKEDLGDGRWADVDPASLASDPFAAEAACMASGEGDEQRYVEGVIASAVNAFAAGAGTPLRIKPETCQFHAEAILAALRATPADPRPDAPDEALKIAREYVASALDEATFEGDPDSIAGVKADLAKIDAVIGGAG
jgi:hypothetical protein